MEVTCWVHFRPSHLLKFQARLLCFLQYRHAISLEYSCSLLNIFLHFWPQRENGSFRLAQLVTYLQKGRDNKKNYSLLPLREPFLRVESVGIGVTSSMRPIFKPARAKALRADWAPGPGVLVLFPPVALILICTAVTPNSFALAAASMAASIAA